MNSISIALCTYNGERFLQSQLDSFVSQTQLPDELVVCDDASNDETTQIVEQFASVAPFPVKLFVNDANIGSTRNFEKAISLCTGDLIFLSDQDDVWLPRKVERIGQEFAKNEDVGLVFSDADLVDEDLTPLGRRLSSLTFGPGSRDDLRNGNAFDSLVQQDLVTGATAAFRSRLRALLLPTPDGVPNLIHDAWIAISIANEGPITFVDEPLIKYRQHGSQQIGLRLDGGEARREFFEATLHRLNDDVTRLKMLNDLFAELPRFEPHPSIEDFLQSKRDYMAHCQVRMDLPGSITQRIGPILKELATGRYARFSRGVLSAAKDMVRK